MPPGRTLLDKKGLGQDKLAAIWSLLIYSTLPRRKKKGEKEEEKKKKKKKTDCPLISSLPTLPHIYATRLVFHKL